MKTKLVRIGVSRAASREHVTETAAKPRKGNTLSSLTAKKGDPSFAAETACSVRQAIYAIADGASYLSIDQVSRVLGIADQTVRNQISAGVFAIPSLKIGRRRLLATEAVIAFVLRSNA